MSLAMTLPLIKHPIIEALLIVHKNDSSTPIRARLLEQAKGKLQMDAEKILLEAELNQLPKLMQREVAKVQSEYKYRMEDIQQQLDWNKE